MSKKFFITEEEIRAACYWRGIRESLERIDNKMKLQEKQKTKGPSSRQVPKG